jgi:hypothetical protein
VTAIEQIKERNDFPVQDARTEVVIKVRGRIIWVNLANLNRPSFNSQPVRWRIMEMARRSMRWRISMMRMRGIDLTS